MVISADFVNADHRRVIRGQNSGACLGSYEKSEHLSESLTYLRGFIGIALFN